MPKQEHITGKLAERLARVASDCRGFFVVGPPPVDDLEGWTLSEGAACQQAVTSGDGATIWTTGHIAGVRHRLEREGHRAVEGRFGSWHCVFLRLGHNGSATHPVDED